MPNSQLGSFPLSLYLFRVAFIASVDDHIGRPSKDVLSERTLMELLIAGFTDVSKICGSLEDLMELEDWAGVILEAESDAVIQVDWFGLDFEGPLELEWLPLQITDFNACENQLSGTLNLTGLPLTLRELILHNNQFVGPVDLTQLPNCMVRLALSTNKLCGSLNLEHLPAKMEYLSAYVNHFTGSINLTALPSVLTTLCLHENCLSGNVDFNSLPGPLSLLNLAYNEDLCGSLSNVACEQKMIIVHDTSIIVNDTETR